MKQTGYLSLTKKAVIKRFFTSNKQVFTSLLQEFFSITDEVLDVVVVDTGREGIFDHLRQTSKPEDLPDIHRVVLDLMVKLSSGEKIGIQLQVAINEEKDFRSRMLYDWGCLHRHDQNEFTDPSGFHPTYSLIFTHFTVFEERKSYITDLELRADKNPDYDLDAGIRMVIVALNRFNKGCSELISMQDRWSYIMKHSADLTTEQIEHLSQDEDARMVLEHLGEISKDGSSD